MKLTAMAVMLAFVAVPALAQQYPSAGSPSASSPSATDQATPSANGSTSSTDDTRVASNRHHKRSQSAIDSKSQMDSSSQSSAPSPDMQAPATPSPTPQQ